jgi:hypothetical protein
MGMNKNEQPPLARPLCGRETIMSLLKKLSKIFITPPKGKDENSMWITVQCNRCGEQIHARVDLRNELSIEYSPGGTTYHCHKVLIGSEKLCFQKMDVSLTFDASHNLIDREITGGKFVEEK